MRPICPRLVRAAAVVLVVACGDPTAGNLDQPPGANLPADTPSPDWADRTDLGTFGGVASYAFDINDAGVVVGTAETAAGVRRAFRWTREAGLQDLGTLPGDVGSVATRIAENGAILGASFSSDSVARTVTWTPDGAISQVVIPTLPGKDRSVPADLDQAGRFAGFAAVAEGCTQACGLVHTWVWSAAEGIVDVDPAGFETYPGQLNPAGVLVGTRYGSTVGLARPYLWARATGLRELADFPGPGEAGMVVAGLALNNRGQAVGWAQAQGAQVAGQKNGPWVWDEATGFRTLPMLSTDEFCCHYAAGINDAGLIVGASSQDQPAFAIVAAAWPTSGGVVRLEGASPNASVALAVNAAGIAVGWADQDGLSAGHNHAIAWNVPAIVRKSTPVASVGRPPRARVGPAPSLRGSDRCLAPPTSRSALVSCALALTAAR